jgi:AbrB family looped-hinge helix DNA binding protein
MSESITAVKEFISSVSPKGQITIPLEIRQQLGIKPKDKVAFIVEDGEVRIAPAKSRLQASYQAVPALKQPRSLDEMIDIAQEEQAREAAREGLCDA